MFTQTSEPLASRIKVHTETNSAFCSFLAAHHDNSMVFNVAILLWFLAFTPRSIKAQVWSDAG